MRFTAQEEYGLRCMLQLARHVPAPPASMSLGEIAENESLTPAYAGKLMRALRQAGLVEGTRGQKGGYHLARPAAEITAGEVLVALGGKLYTPEFCSHHTGTVAACVHSTDCSIRSLWDGLDRLVHSVLDRCSLLDLLDGRGPDVMRSGPPRSLPVAGPLGALDLPAPREVVET